jgi:hypothetical protein
VQIVHCLAIFLFRDSAPRLDIRICAYHIATGLSTWQSDPGRYTRATRVHLCNRINALSRDEHIHYLYFKGAGFDPFGRSSREMDRGEDEKAECFNCAVRRRSANSAATATCLAGAL